jgi:hypothetical protein
MAASLLILAMALAAVICSTLMVIFVFSAASLGVAAQVQTVRKVQTRRMTSGWCVGFLVRDYWLFKWVLGSLDSSLQNSFLASRAGAKPWSAERVIQRRASALCS